MWGFLEQGEMVTADRRRRGASMSYELRSVSRGPATDIVKGRQS